MGLDGEYIYTVERPWLDNKPEVSCVPTGNYSLEPHDSARFPDTWALIGDTVSHYPTPGKARSTILFHVANTMHDVKGCIGPGLALGVLGDSWAVLRSREGMKKLRDLIREEGEYPSLIIRNYEGGKP